MPRFEVRVTAAADADIAEKDAWWRVHRSDAADRVRTEMARAGEVLTVSPSIGTLYEDATLPRVRRLRLRGTPYHAYYWVDEAAQIVWVLRVWSGAHAKGPKLTSPR